MLDNFRLWLIKKLQPIDWEDNNVPSLKNAIGVLPREEADAMLNRAMKRSAKYLISTLQTLGYNTSVMRFELDVPGQEKPDCFELLIRRTEEAKENSPTFYKYDLSTRV